MELRDLPPARSRVRRFAIASALVLSSTLASELAARGLFRVLGRPYDGEKTRELAGTWRNAASGALPLGGDATEAQRTAAKDERRELHPYFGWEHAIDAQHVAEELDYYRTEEAERTFDVCILGGSVAGAFEAYGSARLGYVLGDDPRFARRPLRVHGHARAGYKQPQLLFVLEYLLALGHRPDAVIELDGFNEAALANANIAGGMHPVYPADFLWNRWTTAGELDPELLERFDEALVARRALVALAERFEDSGAWKSCILGKLGVLRLATLRLRSVEAQEALARELGQRARDGEMPRGPPIDADSARQDAAILRVWEESSVSMAAVCASRGIVYLHVLQPTLHDEGSKTWTAEETASAAVIGSWSSGVHRLYPEMRRIGARLVERGVAFHDSSLVFRDVRETIYIDGCHFAERGNRLLADDVGRALLAVLGQEPLR
jgi:hypothetical protein